MPKTIYYDHAATTPPHPTVLEAMATYNPERGFGNPSSLHHLGQEAKQVIQQAWQSIYTALEAPEGSLGILTGGGTEADNLAVLGVMRALKQNPETRHRNVILTSAFEHPAVLEPAQHLARHEGFIHECIPVTEAGFVTPEALETCLTRHGDRIGLVSVMHAHNEVGSIQPIQTLAKQTHNHGGLFHTDAVQTVGKIPVSMTHLGVDYLSFSGHKLYGPKGTGILLIAPDAPHPEPLMYGGGQQYSLRPGTENTAGLLGTSTALAYCHKHWQAHTTHLQELGTSLHEAVMTVLAPWATLHGSQDFTQRLPGHLNYAFTHTKHGERYPIEGESLVLKLALKGIAVSSGSACHSTSLAPSDALLAMGVPLVQAQSSIRFSLGIGNTPDEIPVVITALQRILAKVSSS